MNKRNILIIILILAVIGLALGVYIFGIHNKEASTSLNGESISSEVSSVSEIESVAKEDNIKDENFSSEESYAVELSETYKITKGGVYIFTGEISDGYIYVDTEDSVKIILNNVKITNSNGPAIYIASSDKTYIELAEDSQNYLADGSSYNLEDEDVNGVIYSKDDLVLTGTGTLNITANYKDAVVSKDDLKIENGTYIINSEDDGLRGKDSVVIENGNFTINAKGDAIKSTNDTDESKGYIYVSNGTFDITAEGDGFSAITDIEVDGGEFKIITGGGAANATTVRQDNFRNFTAQNTTSSSDEKSTKAIKAENNIVINGGTFNIDSKDDSIHSNNYIGIKNGTFNISSGDDGMHADSTLIIEDGTINITKSYEGLEAENITINGGNISIVSTDDGINVAGGAGSSDMFMQRGGMSNQNATSTTTLLTINGGYIYVNASGDGLDSNGSIKITGGYVVVNGPTDNGNTAVDYERECVINGGTLIASGSSGMVEGVSTSSLQGFINVNLSSTVSAGDIITIKDSSENEILTYSASKNYTNLIVSMSTIKNGETYTIYTGVTESASSKDGVYELGGATGGNETASVVAGKNVSGGFGGGVQGGPNGRNSSGMMQNDGTFPNGQMNENFENDMQDGMTPPDQNSGNFGRQGGRMNIQR